MPFGRPFSAISLCVSFPGLKPWAVFCSPVGRLELAQENVQTPESRRDSTIVARHEVPGLQFGHFLVRIPSARRTYGKQPRASALGKRGVSPYPSRIESCCLQVWTFWVARRAKTE